jgi:hypothetical protein
MAFSGNSGSARPRWSFSEYVASVVRAVPPPQDARIAPPVPVSLAVWWCSHALSVCVTTAYRPPGNRTVAVKLSNSAGVCGFGPLTAA